MDKSALMLLSVDATIFRKAQASHFSGLWSLKMVAKPLLSFHYATTFVLEA